MVGSVSDGLGQHDVGVPTASIAIAIVFATGVMEIGIVSGGVNDAVSGCLPVVALTATTAAITVIVTGTAVIVAGVVVDVVERKLNFEKIWCCDLSSQHSRIF